MNQVSKPCRYKNYIQTGYIIGDDSTTPSMRFIKSGIAVEHLTLSFPLYDIMEDMYGFDITSFSCALSNRVIIDTISDISPNLTTLELRFTAQTINGNHSQCLEERLNLNWRTIAGKLIRSSTIRAVQITLCSTNVLRDESRWSVSLLQRVIPYFTESYSHHCTCKICDLR